jgi:hypothetical protein
MPVLLLPGTAVGPKPSQPMSVATLYVRARRFWKRIGDKDSGYHPLLTRAVRLAFRAAKLGIYLKIIIVCVLFLRLACHSAQMATPSAAISPSTHLAAIRTAAHPPALRIIVITAHGDPAGLTALLSSLETATFEPNISVALDLWLFTTTKANALPIFLLPLAVALFGPPRFDHNVAAAARSFGWHHGSKTLIATRTEQNWVSTWSPVPNTANETLLFIDAARARSLSPTFYSWLKSAKSKRTDVLAYALDALSITPCLATKHHGNNNNSGSPAPSVMGNSILIETFFPGTAAFSPTFDGWVTFLKWHRKHSWGLLNSPVLHPATRVGSYDRWEAQRVDPVRAWFAQFAYEYEARVVYPMLPDSQVLVVRKPGLSDPAYTAGVGVEDVTRSNVDEYHVSRSVHLSVDAEVRANEYVDSGASLIFAQPDEETVLKWDGAYDSANSPFGQRTPSRTDHATDRIVASRRGSSFGSGDILNVDSSNNHDKAVRQIASFAFQNNQNSVTIVPVSKSSIDSVCNWLCNVGTLHIVPAGLVLLASNDSVGNELRRFVSSSRTLSRSQSRPLALVLSLQHVLTRTPSSPRWSSGAEVRLTLDRALIVRDVLRRGLSVFLTSSDQVWLHDPVPYVLAVSSSYGNYQGGSIDTKLDGYLPDFIAPVTSKGLVSASFLFIRSTLASIHAWNEATRLAKNHFEKLHNEASIVPDLSDNRYSFRQFLESTLRRYIPVGSKLESSPVIALLKNERFVDGSWYLNFDNGKDGPLKSRVYYPSLESRQPVLVSNDYLESSDARMETAKRSHHWFLTSTKTCDEKSVHQAAMKIQDEFVNYVR